MLPTNTTGLFDAAIFDAAFVYCGHKPNYQYELQAVES